MARPSRKCETVKKTWKPITAPPELLTHPSARAQESMFFRLLSPPAAAILHKDLSSIGLFKNLPGGSWEHAASLPEVSQEASREASWETPGRSRELPGRPQESRIFASSRHHFTQGFKLNWTSKIIPGGIPGGSWETPGSLREVSREASPGASRGASTISHFASGRCHF